MKILVIDHNAILSADRAIYRRLSQMDGIELTLVVPERWREYFGEFTAEKEESSLRVIAGRALFSGRSHRAWYPELATIWTSVQPDIIYVEAEPESYLACQAVRLRKKVAPTTKVVFMSWRNIDYSDGGFPYKLSFLHALAEKTVLAEADHCVAHIQAAEDIFLRKQFTHVTVIPPAIDTTIFKKSDSQRLREKLGLHAFTIGYIGRCIREKGVECLLRAAALLSFDYQFVLLGDGPCKNEWKELGRELKIAQKIIWIEPQPHHKVADYMNTLDVLVLPSYGGRYWKEQFGRVLVEAMACGVPVIGSNSGEIPNVIGDAGLIVRERDVDDLREKICALHDNEPLRKELAEKGRERVERYYSVEVVARQYDALFKKLFSM